MKPTSNLEVEIKLKAEGSLAKIRSKLREAGLALGKRRVFEENIVFDTADPTLARSGRALRLRRAGSVYTLTYKGPVAGGPHKTREEIETTVASFKNLELIVTRLGYVPVFRYEKYRTEYRKGKTGGVVTLDETPIGVFFEIEGAPEWIDRMAAKLGFAPSDYITRGYADLYRRYCQEHGITPGNMVFKA